MPHELETFQDDAVTRHIEKFNGRSLLAADPGLGKTLMALETLKRMGPKAWPVVVVCPSAVKWGWVKEALHHLGIHVNVLEGRTTRPLSTSRKQITVVNYDIISYWKKEILKMKPQTLIIDECQFVSNKVQRSKACIALGRKVPYLMALSGTPLTNRPSELFNILNLLCPKEFSSFFEFGSRYCDPKLKPWGWEYKGATNLDELHQRLTDLCMTRIVKSEVTDLPEKVTSIELLQLSDQEEYELAETDFIRWLSLQDISRVKRAKKAEALTKIGYLKQLTARLKLRATVAWIDNWFENSNGTEKLLVFGIHQKMLNALNRRCQQKSVLLNGQVTGSKKKQTLDQFRFDPTTRLFLGNINSAGVGIDGLQNVSNTVAFCELPWRPADIIQAVDRVNRIGQQNTTFVHFLISEGTIEEKLCALLEQKQEVIMRTLNGVPSADRSGALHTQLMEVMRSESARTANRSRDLVQAGR